jgi:hypothetical protein
MLVTNGVATLAETSADQPSVAELRVQLAQHPVYAATVGPRELRILMEHQVFAVWDVMSLLKVLQRGLTCVDVPWTPRCDGLAGRLVNETVLATETDLEGGSDEPTYISHFELYRAAMAQCGADTRAIDTFVARIENGCAVREALAEAAAPPAAQAFVSTTFDFIESGCGLHVPAAALAVGRREPLPEALQVKFAELAFRFPDHVALLGDFARRHTAHNDALLLALAKRILSVMCANDADKRREAEVAAKGAIEARVRLWDEVLNAYGNTAAARLAPRILGLGHLEDGL